MPRFHSICFVVLLLLNTVTCALAESNQEYARLLADEKDAKTLTVSNKDGAKKSENFLYGDGIKFTAVYPKSCLQKYNDYATFNLLFGDCNLSFSWTVDLLKFIAETPQGNFVIHRGKDVPVEITDRVVMNGKEDVGSATCTAGLKKDSEVNVAVSGDLKCPNLALIFENAFVQVQVPTSTQSPPVPKKAPAEVKSGNLWMYFGIGAAVFVVLIIIAVIVALLCLKFRRRPANASNDPAIQMGKCEARNSFDAKGRPIEVSAISSGSIDKKTTPMKTGIQKTGDMKTGIQKTGDMKTGVQRTGDMKTGAQLSEEIGPVVKPRNAREQQIFEGLTCGRHEYKTMDDAPSEWSDERTHKSAQKTQKESNPESELGLQSVIRR